MAPINRQGSSTSNNSLAVRPQWFESTRDLDQTQIQDRLTNDMECTIEMIDWLARAIHMPKLPDEFERVEDHAKKGREQWMEKLKYTYDPSTVADLSARYSGATKRLQLSEYHYKSVALSRFYLNEYRRNPSQNIKDLHDLRTDFETAHKAICESFNSLNEFASTELDTNADIHKYFATFGKNVSNAELEEIRRADNDNKPWLQSPR